MPYYFPLKVSSTNTPEIAAAKKRAMQRLLALKKALDKEIPQKQVDGKLLLATWNIREFGEGKFRGWASKAAAASGDAEDEAGMKGRFEESVYYLAEIVSRFDLVALQEVRDDLEDLDRLRSVLGSWWKHLVTDVTAGTQGNRERVAFLYDERKVKFGGLAGEVVLPPARDGTPAFQLARTPYIVGFKAGWFNFTICSTHLYYGGDKADDPQRLKEMDLLAGFLAAEVRKPTAWARNMILLGDFNIFSTKDQQFQVLTTKHKFTVPRTMIGRKTNVGENHPYDQIAFLAPSVDAQLEHSASGAFPFFQHVFTDADEAEYAKAMGAGYLKDSKGNPRAEDGRRNYYRKWRTYQMSDHNPLWVELETDFSAAYLEALLKR